MLDAPKEEVRRALAGLEGNPNFDTIVEWLHSSHARLVKESEALNEVVQVFRNQGARQLLSDFDKHLASSTRRR